MSNFKKYIALSALGLPLGVFIALNFTKISVSKIRENIEKLKYTASKDLWWQKENNKKLVIFLHGMYAPPDYFDEIAFLLIENGWDVYAPALPCSARTTKEIKELGPWSWDESIKIAKMKIENSRKGYETVVLGGHSQGGSFALDIASEFDYLDGLIVVSSPVSLYAKGLGAFNNLCIYFSGILQYIRPQGVDSVVKNYEEKLKVEVTYDSTQVNFPKTVYSFKYGLKKVRKNLHKIKMPLFLGYSKNDRVVSFANKIKIETGVSSKEIVSVAFDIPREMEAYSTRHKLFNYIHTKNELNYNILKFLNSL